MPRRIFWSCLLCSAKYCKRFLIPGKFDYSKCSFCMTRSACCHIQIFQDSDSCDCYVHSCNECGNILCLCTIQSIQQTCPWCKKVSDWVIMPLELFDGTCSGRYI